VSLADDRQWQKHAKNTHFFDIVRFVFTYLHNHTYQYQPKLCGSWAKTHCLDQTEIAEVNTIHHLRGLVLETLDILKPQVSHQNMAVWQTMIQR